jgi:hypothetical protein
MLRKSNTSSKICLSLLSLKKLNSILSSEGKLGKNYFHHLSSSHFNINYIKLNNEFIIQ